MRIGLDTTRLHMPGGEHRYVWELTDSLCRTYPDHDFFAFGDVAAQPVRPNLTPVSFPNVDGLAGRLTYALRLARALRRWDLDIFHNLANLGFIRSPVPTVTTVHDLATVKFPAVRKGGRFKRQLYLHLVPRLLSTASFIVTDSHSTTRDLNAIYGLTTNVETVHLGFNENLFHPKAADDSRILDRYGLVSGYLLFVGVLVPKKNLEVLIEAISLAHDAPDLVLVGTRGHGADAIFAHAKRRRVESRLRELGHVPDEHLGPLYRQASVALLPSVYEGFGLPALEAMACGTPVLVSTSGSLPEVVGDESLTCDPLCAGDWATKIRVLTRDEERIEAVRRSGLERSTRFTWEACARRTMQVYMRVLSEHAP